MTSRLSVPPSGQAGSACAGAVVATDGRRIVYHSPASTLVGHDHNGRSDVFVAAFGARTYDRVQGGSVYATAVQASRRAAPHGAAAVVVTNGGDWRSALAGSSLAGAVRGPILYVGKTWLPSDTRAEILRLGAKRVYVVGGTGLVSDAIAKSLAAIPGVTGVERVGSGSSYSVANTVASKVVGLRGAAFDGRVLVVSGRSAASTIAGVPLASATGRPVVFVNPSTGKYALPARTSRAYVLGGKSVVSSAVFRRLQRRLGRSRVKRLSGSDRYLTAVAVAKRAVSLHHASDQVVIVNVAKPTEAISGAVMAGRMGSVVLYSTRASLPTATQARLKASKYRVDTVYVIGRTSSIGSSPLRYIKKALGG